MRAAGRWPVWNVLRWPYWLQNALLVLAGLPIAAWIGKLTSQNPALLLQFAILSLLLVPGFILAAAQSPQLMPYVLLVWAVGPGIRRLADWAMGAYTQITLLSLAPLLATALLALPIVRQPLLRDRTLAGVVQAYLIPYAYAACLGLALNKAAGIYSIAGACLPALILLYLTMNPPTERQKDAWIRFYVTTGGVLSAYAWIQYLYLPPWDRLWMEGAQMVSLGIPEPMQFRAFSTLNATGTLALFLVSALIPAIASKRWRGPLGIPGILLMLSALAITLVRASWVTLIAGIVAYILFASQASRWRILLTLGLLVAAGVFLLPLLPGAETMTDRMATFGELGEDHSANARWMMTLSAIPDLLSNPLGAGFGGIGRSAVLIGSGNAFAGLATVDNGYLGIFATFGLIGGTLYFRALFLHWRAVAQSKRDPAYRALGLAAIVQLLVGLLFGGTLSNLEAVLFWLFAGLALRRTDVQAQDQPFTLGGTAVGSPSDRHRQPRGPVGRSGAGAHEPAGTSRPGPV